MDVEAGCEGFGAGAGEDDGAGGRAGGEVGEEARELMPHSVFIRGELISWLADPLEIWIEREVSLLFFEGVHLIRAVDLDVGDEGERVGQIEVFALWRR